MVFKKCLRPCPSDESGLSIGRVSNEYQHDWVSLVFRYICGLVPPTKVTSLLQGELKAHIHISLYESNTLQE